MNYEKVLRYADDELRDKILKITKEHDEKIVENRELKKKQEAYSSALEIYDHANSEYEYQKVISLLKDIKGFEDSQAIILQCEAKIEEEKIDKIKRKELFEIELAKRKVESYHDSIKLITSIFATILGILAFIFFILVVGSPSGFLGNLRIVYIMFYLLMCMYLQVRCAEESQYVEWTMYAYVLGALINAVFSYWVLGHSVLTIMLGIFAIILHLKLEQGKEIVYGDVAPNLKLILGIIVISSIVIGIIAIVHREQLSDDEVGKNEIITEMVQGTAWKTPTLEKF